MLLCTELLSQRKPRTAFSQILDAPTLAITEIRLVSVHLGYTEQKKIQAPSCSWAMCWPGFYILFLADHIFFNNGSKKIGKHFFKKTFLSHCSRTSLINVILLKPQHIYGKEYVYCYSKVSNFPLLSLL